MRKALMFALVLLISVAFVTAVFAQAKPEAKPADQPAAVAAEKAPAAEKTPAPEKKAEKTARARIFKGELVTMDGAAKTIVAKDGKGEMTFDVSGVKKMAELAAGDKIMIAYVEKDGKMVAKNVAKKAAKKSPAKMEKKEAPGKEEAKPAADKPVAPAPAPAPAPEKK